MTPTVKTFSELSLDELYGILQLRAEVFVLEQQCPYQDLDRLDQAGRHLMCWQNEKLIAYARLLPAGQRYPADASIGRVVTAQPVRGSGLGRQLMLAAIAECGKTWPESDITISAQAYLEKFYQQLGFRSQGEPYLEDGIPHIQMQRPANSAQPDN